ncbi:MAG: thioredoxin domain-containing protein [Steroidobacteraceae bacterium]
MADQDPRTNRLAASTSPYLLQHATNPVEWHPWDATALELARTRGKPILLSIGYSACHWCHVMAHESFEDAATAAVMNEHFVNIKVDREERPDLDRIYQIAHQMLTQRGGGWPLTMFLSHDDQQPFFGGTYFPGEARHGLPAFRELLLRVAEYYRTQQTEIRAQNAALVQRAGRSRATACSRRRAARRRAAAGGPRDRRAALRPRLGRLRWRAEVSASRHAGAADARLACDQPAAPSPTCTRCTWRR